MTRRKRPAGKDELLAAARTAIEAGGGRPMAMNKFFASSGMNCHHVYKHFATWNDLQRAAGFDFKRYNQAVDDSHLLADWASIVRKLRHPPSPRAYDRLGKYGRSTLLRRFGSWGRVRSAFPSCAARNPQWKDILPLLHKPANPRRPRPAAYAPAKRRRPRRSAPIPNGRPICGDLLQIGPMRNAPLNEMGVVFLFAILAPALGFQIEALQASFPDCEAKRRVSPRRTRPVPDRAASWQSVRIEFEFESRNFRTHGHPPEGCDIIVCWTHNWPDCPKNLEVIELREELESLRGRGARAAIKRLACATKEVA